MTKQFLRGVPLIELIIEHVERGESEIEIFEPRPVPYAVLKTLTFSNGRPLPPSMRRWLAFDISWLERRFGFGSPESLRLESAPIAELVDQSGIGGGIWGQEFVDLPDAGLEGEGVPLDIGSDSMRLLYLGNRDEFGEYPVFCADVDDSPCLDIRHVGWDVWLAEQAGVDVPGIDSHGDRWLKSQAKNNLGGAKYVENWGMWVGQIGDRQVWETDCPVGRDRFEGPDDLGLPDESAWKQVDNAAPIPRMSVEKLGGLLNELIELGEQQRALTVLEAGLQQHKRSKKWRNSALVVACEQNDRPLAAALLDSGANPDTSGRSGWTVLAGAVRAGNLELCELLLERGASIDKLSQYKQSALYEACDGKLPRIAGLLLERGADPSIAEKNGITPLHAACRLYHRKDRERDLSAQLCQLMIDAGAALDAQDKSERAAVHWAIDTHNREALALLIDAGAQLDLQNCAGDTALTLAFKSGDPQMLELVKEGGARVDIVNKDGWCFGGVTGPGGVGPADLTVRYRASDKMQRLHLSVQLLNWNKAYTQLTLLFPFTVGAVLRALETGMGGSSHYGPEDVEVVVRKAPKPKEDHKPKVTYQFDWELDVRCVSPDAMRVLLIALERSLYESHLAGLGLVGKIKPDRSELSLNSDQVRALFAADSLNYRAYAEPPFDVEHKPAKSPGARVLFSSGYPAADEIEVLLGNWGNLLGPLTPRSSSWTGWPKIGKGTTYCDVELVDKDSPASFDGDREICEALLINGLTRLYRRAPIKKLIIRL